MAVCLDERHLYVASMGLAYTVWKWVFSSFHHLKRTRRFT